MTDESIQWETIDVDVAYRCPGFEVLTERVRLPDGTETTFDFLSEPPAVVILPFTPAGDVVIIQEWRQAVKRINIGLPAGTMEPVDRTIEDTAIRELAEETGYETDQLEPLTIAEPANGLLDVAHHYFVAYDCRPTADRNLDHNESITVDTTTLSSLRRSLASDDVLDARTALAVLYYGAFGDG